MWVYLYRQGGEIVENVKYTDVTTQIVKEYHSELKKTLPETEALVLKILKVHFNDNHEVLIKVHRLYSQLKNSLELLFVKKEVVLFPLIADYQREPSKEGMADIKVLIHEIELGLDAVEKILDELRRVTRNYRVPPTACMTFEKTYQDLEKLEGYILKEIALERDVLYKRLKEESIH